MAGDCPLRKEVTVFPFDIVLSVSCLRLDLVLIKGIKWQFRIPSQYLLSTKQVFLGVLEYTLSFTFLSLRDCFSSLFLGPQFI